jgi:DHA2 family lincomycin resistance protein-like MFS transporter
MGIFLFILSRVQVTTSVLTIALLDAGIYFGIALAWAPVQSTALQQLSTRSQAHGVAIINTFVQLGSALGTPLFVGLMTAGKNSYLMNSQQLDTALVHTQALYSGFNYAISVGTIIIFTAFLAALLLRLKK